MKLNHGFKFASAAVALCLLASVALAAFNFPQLAGRVTDQANIISAPAKASIEAKLQNLEDKSGIQLVVATVSSLEGGDIESYANGLFRAWKLGMAKKNNGVLFLIAPNERKMRIEVGYGLEGVLTDAVSSVIIRSAVAPRFKAGDFTAGSSAASTRSSTFSPATPANGRSARRGSPCRRRSTSSRRLSCSYCSCSS